MGKIHEKIHSGWRRLSRGARMTLLVVLVLGVGIRLALPYAIRDYVNRQLNKNPGYRGHVAKINLWLIRGAYEIKGLKIEKNNGSIPVPFVTIPDMDLSIHWRELMHGSIVGKVELTHPQVNFVNGPTDEQSQNGTESKNWKETLESLFPFDINLFQVNNGDIRFRDFSRNPKVDIYLTNLFATATNLSNSRNVRQQLPAGLLAQGKTIGNGEFRLDLKMNPLAAQPTFKLNTAISNMDLVALNDFFRAYGKFDVAKGDFEGYLEIAAADGRYEGYVKPFFKDLAVFDWQKEKRKNILKIFWQAIVAGVTEVLRNQPHNQLATKIPISGNFATSQSHVDYLATIGGILKNAFIRAALPKIDQTVAVQNLESKTPPISPTSR